MIKKSEKLVCAFVSLMSEKYQGTFELKNLLFTAQELIDRANSLFNDPARVVGALDLQNATKEIGSAANQKLFVRGSADSLSDYYRFGCPGEVSDYNLRTLINKLMPVVDQCLPKTYLPNSDEAEERPVKFLNEYFRYIKGHRVESQTENTALSSREAVWIAAVTLTYNEYARTGSNDIDQYAFPQSSIVRLASVMNPQTATATYSQVTGQMVTQGRNNQQYAYLIPVDDRRRVAASGEAAKTKPERLSLTFEVNTINGKQTVQQLLDFVESQYTPFIVDGEWGGIQRMHERHSDPLHEKIHFVIKSYKENFETVDKQERYKWEAIGWYKQHWKINAENFAEMLENALSKTKNLLTSGMYYAYASIVSYAQVNPEEVRRIFRVLHDETPDRIKA